MNIRDKHNAIVIFASSIAAMVFIYWFSYNPTKEFQASLPGLDERPKNVVDLENKVEIGESFKNYTEFQSKLKGKWPRFRGENFDNIVDSELALIDKFKDGKAEVLWKHPMGEGHAAPVIYNGRVYILDYIEAKKQDALRCFSLETGEELWRRWYKVHIKRNHGMSRTIPAVSDKYLLSIGPRGHVMCLDPISGDLLWSIDLVEKYGTNIPFWYTGQCPMIDNGVAVLAPGTKALMIGVDCSTGNVLWETPNADSLQMSHSSIVKMNIENKDSYVYAGIGGMVAVSAEKDNAGELLWYTREFTPNVIAPSPLYLGERKIFMSAGYGAGSALFEVAKDNKSVKLLEKYKPKDGLASEQQTPILWNGRLFGIMPKDGGAYRNQFVCVDPENPKEVLWSSEKAHRYGLGPYVWADGKFYILNDDGTLNIVRASTEAFEILDKTRVVEGHDAWGPLAIADGYLLMRDSKNLLCLNIKK